MKLECAECDRQALYYLEGEYIVYCESCAQALRRMGYKVHRLPQQETEDTRGEKAE